MNERGHSLVEVLAALALLGLLAAAALRWLAPALDALGRAGASIAAQRSLRRAQEALRADLLEAGFAVPFPGRVPLAAVELPREGGLVIRRDEVLQGEGVLGEATGEAPVLVLAWDRPLRLEGLEWAGVGGAWEALPLRAPADLAPGVRTEVRVGAVPAPHRAGAPVVLLRPDRTVTYRLGRTRAGRGLLRGDGGGERLAARGITAFETVLRPGGPGRPPLVEVRLEAGNPPGPRRETRFGCAPRSAGGWP
jgi:prepilin-type N-terminal cleavage/methylation domain-containing protein